MGYWKTNENGESFTKGSEMVWGDAPANFIDSGIEADGITTEAEALLAMNTPGSMFSMHVGDAVGVFTKDVGREPTKAEILAGIRFSLSGVPNKV